MGLCSRDQFKNKHRPPRRERRAANPEFPIVKQNQKKQKLVPAKSKSLQQASWQKAQASKKQKQKSVTDANAARLKPRAFSLSVRVHIFCS